MRAQMLLAVPDVGVNPDDVSPGLLGFLVIFAAALACIPLFRSMTSKLRGVEYRGRQEEDAARRLDDGTSAGGTALSPDDGGPGPTQGGASRPDDGTPESADGAPRA